VADAHKLCPDEFHKWVEEKANRSEQIVYTGESLRAVAMPLGGIGCGELCLAGDGSLRQWQIFNQVNHNHFIPDSFFAICARQHRSHPFKARALIWDGLYDEDYEGPASSSDHIVPPQLKQMMQELPGVAGIEYIGEYPIAELRYLDDSLPVEVSLEAFSPMVPLDTRASGYPAAVFNFTVTNPGDAQISGALMATLQNAVGQDAQTPVTGTRCPCYGGNLNELVREDGFTAICMRNLSPPEDDPGYGTMALATLSDEASALLQWDELGALWQKFAGSASLGLQSQRGPSPEGSTYNGALCVPFTLEAGESKVITFIIAWHFPNHYVNWGQSHFGVEEGSNRYYIGNMYNNRFSDALDVTRQLVANLPALAEQTRLWRDTFYDSTLPYWLLDCISSQTSTIRTPVCLWNEDGSFHGFEGACGASTGSWCSGGGCCPLNCTHVWNYEMSLSKLYPELERSMRRTDLIIQLGPEGQIPHRTVLPFFLPRWGGDEPGGEILACDGHWGTILKAYREFRQGGGLGFLHEVWDPIKQAMAFGISKWDPDEDGVLSGEQWNTYDLFFYGANTFCTGLYLAALRAAEEMAKTKGEEELATYWRGLFDKGSAWVDENLFNGEYYEQIFDEAEEGADHHQYGKGCLSDQLFGQWWAHALDLGYIFNPENVKRAYTSIYKYNFWHNFRGHVQQPRIFVDERDKGLITTTWPYGGRQETPMRYADECWSSLAYHVAGGMIWEGIIDAAWHLVAATRERFDGTRRNPFNEPECGDHYVRPMTNWAILEAACGYAYSYPDKSLRFAPRVQPDDVRCFFITATGWGTFSQSQVPNSQENKLEVKSGGVELKTLRLAVPDGVEVSHIAVALNGDTIEVEHQQSGELVTITLRDDLIIEAGQSLHVNLTC